MKKLLLILLCLPMIGFGQEYQIYDRGDYLYKSYSAINVATFKGKYIGSVPIYTSTRKECSNINISEVFIKDNLVSGWDNSRGEYVVIELSGPVNDYSSSLEINDNLCIGDEIDFSMGIWNAFKSINAIYVDKSFRYFHYEGWNEVIKECVDGDESIRDFCTCMVEQISNNYTIESFLAMDSEQQEQLAFDYLRYCE